MPKSKLQHWVHQYVRKIRAYPTSSPSRTVASAGHNTNDHCAPHCVGSDDHIVTIKAIIQDFLQGLPYQNPRTPPNAELRREVCAEILSWDTGLNRAFVDGLTETSCVVAECAYAHTTYQHQRLVAMYTAYVTYIDDQGKNNVESVSDFVQRYAKDERQSNVALDRLASLIGTVHDFCPRISGDAIITNTLEAVTGMHIELLAQGDVVAPDAGRWPYYLRLKTGFGGTYAHFNLMKDWGNNAGTYYLQLIPELELIVVGINDILSFYKETLAGETDNYVHMRAVAEGKTPIFVLRQLVEEVLESIGKIDRLASAQEGLQETTFSFLMGYIECHFNARRYRLEDLGLNGNDHPR